ncbi:hypothetical protein [Endozoicomonas sp. GU-1]|uniref:hypothetical protein n=1 Tax=Endozoicomonas sp. GU-1 TaxID=3009078 RepID=UPI0022B48B8F|nr:hypothetical protein [Endozoicomonas sp. GU-1]WBA80483.1 hypothetical protein O2T12_19410 [Endozoicomonas sp. GU-1]WBA88048.1 hypothetical protein O3276_08615 [Endozoicomonas sp. GU-1]
MPVDSSIKPMTVLEQSVLANDTLLIRDIKRSKSRYVIDGLSHVVLQLPDKIRDPLLPPLPLLKLEQRHSVGRITYTNDPEQQFWSIDRVMTLLLDQNDNAAFKCYLEPVMADNVDLPTTKGSGESECLDASSVVTVLGAHSAHANVNEVRCSTSQKLKKGSYLGVYHPDLATHNKTKVHYREGQFIALSSGEGVILEYKSSDEGLPYWEIVATYQNKDLTVQMNPLLQEKLDFKDIAISNGQYHLPVRAIEELSVLKRKHGICPEVFNCGRSSDKSALNALKKYTSEQLENGRGQAVFSMLVVNDSAAHMIAVRFIQTGNKMVVYLHETIQPKSCVAREIRNFIIAAISDSVQNIRDNSLYFLTTPASGYLQKDYNSCSITAFKVLLSFEKEHNGLDPFFIRLVENSDSEISLVDYQAFNEDAGEFSKEAKVLPVNIKVGSLPLTLLPAVLLKFYQGSQALLSNQQKKTIVSHARKLTLEDYYLRYRFYETETDKVFNVAAFCKTNKSFALWKDMIRNFIPLFVSIFRADFDRMRKNVINRWLKDSMYSDIEINANDLKILKRYKKFITMEADLNTWSEEAVLKWRNQIRELTAWLKQIRPVTTTMNRNKLLWRWCQFLNNHLDACSDVGSLWVGRDVGYVIERLDARLKLLEKTVRSDFPFHFGERFYREPESLPAEPAFEGEPIDSCNVKTEVMESLMEPGRFNRIVMTFPKPLLLASADNERACHDSGSNTSHCKDESLLSSASGESCEEVSAAIADVTKAFSVLDSGEKTPCDSPVAISDSCKSMDLELQCDEKLTDELLFSQDDSPSHASTLGQNYYSIVAKEAAQSSKVHTSSVLKRKQAALETGFSGPPIKKQRLMGVSMPVLDTAATGLAEQANVIRNEIDKDKFKVAIEMLSMVLQGIWTMDVSSKTKASNRLKVLKEAIENICWISNRPNELDSYLQRNTIFGIPSLHDTHKRVLVIAFALDYLLQILSAAGEEVVNEPVSIVTRARFFIARNTGKNGGGVVGENRYDVLAGEFPALFATASVSEPSENESVMEKVLRIRKELQTIGYLMISERINTALFKGEARGRVNLLELLIEKVCSFLGRAVGSYDFQYQLSLEKSIGPAQRKWLNLAALHEYLSSILPGHSPDKSYASVLLTAESYLKEQAKNSTFNNLSQFKRL